MLNDLLLLQAGAARMGIAPAARHPQVQAPGRARVIHVRLDEGGEIAGLAVLASEQVAGLWTFRDGNHNGFPFVQLKAPLLGPDRGAEVKHRIEGADADGTRTALDAAVREVSDWPAFVSDKLIVRCEERRAAVDGIDAASACVPAVLERGVAAMRDTAFRRKLCEALLETEAEGLLGNDGLALVVAALTGEAKQGQIVGPTLYFDVDGGFRHGGRRQSTADVGQAQRHVANIVAALIANAREGSKGVCALTGEQAELHDGPFPKPTLPVVGGAFIYARNVDATPAALRYGDKKTFAVGRDLPPLLAGTVEALTNDLREGRSWRSVPGERAKQSDLLVAAIEVDAEIAFADALTTSPDDIDAEAAEHAAANIEHVIRTFEAATINLKPGEEEPRATLLLLRKIDPGNVKAILSRRLSAHDLFAAARRWAEMQRNVPDLRLPVGKGKAPQRPHRIAPLQLPAVTRASFPRGGSERATKPAPGLPPGEALALFLGDRGAERIAAEALNMILRRQGGLLMATAHERRRGGFGAADNVAALRAVGVLGILLARLGREREDYMTGNAYRLGQLFAAADAVHAGYCADVRGGALPPTLLGNEILGVALRGPIQGLDLLSRRIRPYQAWGVHFAVGEKVGDGPRPVLKDGRGWSPGPGGGQRMTAERRVELVRDSVWGLRDLARLCRDIDRDRLGETPDDVARAEMILGYLAGSYEPRAARLPKETTHEA